MNDTRVPVQKRSIEKKTKIIKAGFELFCEKGYSKTNTVEIAKRAGVSTGVIYCYFKDKREIFCTAFENYLKSISQELISELNEQKMPAVRDFAENWIKSYIELYLASSHTLAQLRMMILEDEGINHFFSDLENQYFNDLINILKKNDIVPDQPLEKICICCTLVDSLRQEKTAFSHNGLDYYKYKEQITKSIINILSK